jgi:glyoxylase-like metal-dependent hydrolase (beta-lactamase superfamily II)
MLHMKLARSLAARRGSMSTASMRCLTACLLLLVLTGTNAQAQNEPQRAITPIAGDLYRFQNNFHYSVFLVTSDAIIATDPIDAGAAQWLKSELSRRFPGKPIRYVIYSHSHADHIAGGQVLADTATVVAHERAKERILAEQVPTAVPALTFSDRMTIEAGGKRVELHYLGRNHSDNTIVMRFPDERALFAVDIVAVKRLPYRDFPDGYLDEWIQTLKTLESMDFDILAPGHGTLGTRADVAEHRRYLELLRERVKREMDAGRSLEEIKRVVTMPEYASWGSYRDWVELNVEGMHRYLRMRASN